MIVNLVASGGGKISGTVVYRTVASGYSISKGDFVQFNASSEVIPYSDTIGGIAKSSGSGGSSIYVFTP